MRYRPSILKDNHNISHTQPLKEFATLLGGILTFLALSYIILGLLVDLAVAHISVAMETELFNHTPFSFLTIDPDSFDPRQQKLQQLTDELRACLEMERQITVHLKNSDTVNAVALPGGHIVFFTGLLDTLDSENSLSFILGHELGHFKNRDHLRGLGRGLVLMTIASTMTGPNSVLTKLLTPTLQLSQANYSQNSETKADETGLNSLNCYYGHVGGATIFFESLASQQSDNKFRHYFGSHPQIRKRINAIRQQAEKNHYTVKKLTPLLFSENSLKNLYPPEADHPP